jgi:hypothetical protein
MRSLIFEYHVKLAYSMFYTKKSPKL